MNFFSQFTAFYEVVVVDNRLKHYHISLYITILHLWNKNRMSEYVFLYREVTLNYSKIGSYHTYYNALRNLHEWGYIEYLPKQINDKTTKIRLILFEYSDADFTILDEIYDAFMHRADANMHRVVHQDDAFMHSLDADMHPFGAYLHQTGCISASLYKVLKYLKVIKCFFKEKNDKIIFSQNTNQSPLNFISNEEKKENGKRKKIATKKENEFYEFPTQNETVIFFDSNNSNSETALKFYNHYSAIGWVTKNNIPIADWEFAAKTWISNERGNILNTKTDYDEAF